MSDFLIRGELDEVDPDVHELLEIESERQYRRLVLIPSESTAPLAVRQALASTFNNIYAEGYPPESTRGMTEAAILDYDARLAHYRRYGDPRYYKGVEYADIVEALARRRCAELFATNGLGADDLFVNVQPLSGAPANNAVYHALIEPDDVVMGMDLMTGGHLTHGSKVNRSGKLYRPVHYGVDLESERIDYEAVAELAREHRPKILVAGYSSYPWAPDWELFREIADEVGAYFLADVAHIAGPIAAGVIPSPVGIADAVTFTTHKSLCGPRGAAIVTHSEQLANRIDRAVFPGEQGGPHLNTIAAQAVAFKLARSDGFRALQAQVLANCAALAGAMEQAGLRIPFGGTNTHLMNVDCSPIIGPDGTGLSGDQAARILDLAGIVVNRNTIPGDTSAVRPSGIRLGTVWLTQRGFTEQHAERLGAWIAEILQACTPYSLAGRVRPMARAKVDYATLNRVSERVRDLAVELGIDYDVAEHTYPHFAYPDDPPPLSERATISLEGEAAEALLRYVTDTRPAEIDPARPVWGHLYGLESPIEVVVRRSGAGWTLDLAGSDVQAAVHWLRALSDGYIEFDPDDLHRKPPGPVVVTASEAAGERTADAIEANGLDKPWYLGASGPGGSALPAFDWDEAEHAELRHTALHSAHRQLGAKLIPFAGWEMPVWYSSVLEEHNATRSGAGLFDVSHMGVYQAEGAGAAAFVDSVVCNEVAALEVGQSLYTHLLDQDGQVLDDLMVYRRGDEQYLMVVNAANDDKVGAWLRAVLDGSVRVDNERPWANVYGRLASVRDLRDPDAGDEMRVDLALQGPRSREILLGLGTDEGTADALTGLSWAGLLEGTFGGIDLIVSRTGYTGERVAFELFVHPDRSPELWEKLMAAGEPLGLKPAGLGARDSLRTEAGLPLYGQELAGQMNLGVGDAGFAAYVKTYKPWFIGRSAFLEQERGRKREVVRFRFDDKGVRMAHYGDQVVDEAGEPIGVVTSCAIDSDRRLTGQAHIDRDRIARDLPIAITRERGEPSPAKLVARFGRF